MHFLRQPSTSYRLITPESEAEWVEYHRIRREILFEARGRFGIYNADHSDEKKSNNFPKLLVFNDMPVGTVRIDLPKVDYAIVRMVAIDSVEQGKGHGRALLSLIEDFVVKAGRIKLVTNAAKNAVGFYAIAGFVEAVWDEGELDDDHPQMVKALVSV
jgi:GNAT superfamily N-acetyltransferase